MNNLLVFGDSHSCGYEISKNEEECLKLSYGNLIKNKFKIKNYYNYAVAGASNGYISNCVLKECENINDPENTLVIIGWSEPSRMVLDLKIPNVLLHIGPTSFQAPWTPARYEDFVKKSKLEQKEELYNRFKNHTVFYCSECLRDNFFYTDFCYTNDILIRLATSKFLESLNVKYFTFSALNEQKCSNYKTVSKLFSINNVLSIRDNFYFLDKFAIEGNGLTSSNSHLNSLGHSVAAKWISNELIVRDILNPV